MPRIAFQKPRKVEWEILTDRYGRQIAEPFEKGYALTVGNSLRRALLSIIPGAALVWAKIDGVSSAEARIPGVDETTADVLLNLKKLAIQIPSGEPKTIRLEVAGPREVTGADVPEVDGIEVLNPELHLFTLGSGRVRMELGIGVGRGYVAADAHPRGTVPAGALAVDSAFSPILRVGYEVEMSRLGKITDYEKLIIEIWTNGAIAPDEALVRAATYLKQHFSLMAPEGGLEEEAETAESGEDFLRETLAKPIEELPLPARAVNALKNAEIVVVADLAQKLESDLAQVKNLGDKSIEEIKAALAALGLSLGMRIDPTVLGALNRAPR
ncbi:MAG: DNA-directed RNA polymerase subunit alpha [Candidatus Rokuibacteriota bacterium]|nr:MAG: DNA-directed RNA polymerase subunit alpha [Candidatus Rokubacteria bacterium]